jgi:hypothetical protein
MFSAGSAAVPVRRALTPLRRNGTGRLHDIIDPGEYRPMIRLHFALQAAATR